MIKGRDYVTRYSEAFKQQVIRDVENGSLTQSEAVKKYGISNTSVIHCWLRKYGKYHALKRIVRIEMPTELSPNDVIKQLQKDKQHLESALAQAHLKLQAFETMIEIAEKKFSIAIKKKHGTKPVHESLPMIQP